MQTVHRTPSFTLTSTPSSSLPISSSCRSSKTTTWPRRLSWLPLAADVKRARARGELTGKLYEVFLTRPSWQGRPVAGGAHRRR